MASKAAIAHSETDTRANLMTGTQTTQTIQTIQTTTHTTPRGSEIVVRRLTAPPARPFPTPAANPSRLPLKSILKRKSAHLAPATSPASWAPPGASPSSAPPGSWVRVILAAHSYEAQQQAFKRINEANSRVDRRPSVAE